jgi:hypothetical protein
MYMFIKRRIQHSIIFIEKKLSRKYTNKKCIGYEYNSSYFQLNNKWIIKQKKRQKKKAVYYALRIIVY